MLLWLANYLSEYYTGFVVVQYLTLRAIFSVLTALIIGFMVGPYMIRKLRQYQVGQAIRDDGPQSHLSKAGTPTKIGRASCRERVKSSVGAVSLKKKRRRLIRHWGREAT